MALPTLVSAHHNSTGISPSQTAAANGDVQLWACSDHVSIGCTPQTGRGWVSLGSVSSTHNRTHFFTRRVTTAVLATEAGSPIAPTSSGAVRMMGVWTFRGASTVTLAGSGTGLVTGTRTVPDNARRLVIWGDSESNSASGPPYKTITPDAALTNKAGYTLAGQAAYSQYQWYDGLTGGIDPITGGTAPARTAVESDARYPDWADFLVIAGPAVVDYQHNDNSVQQTVTVTPYPTDVIVFAMAHNRSVPRNVTGVTGCGATWAPVYTPGAGRVTFWLGTNPTSAGNVVGTYDGTVAVFNTAMWLLRDPTSLTVVGGFTENAAGGTALTGPVNSAGPGQVVCAIALGGNPIVFPSTQIPAAAYTSTVDGYAGGAHAIPRVTADHRADFTSASTAGAIAIGQVVIGTAPVVVSSPSYGWGTQLV